jgi:hypothetical protein
MFKYRLSDFFIGFGVYSPLKGRKKTHGKNHRAPYSFKKGKRPFAQATYHTAAFVKLFAKQLRLSGTVSITSPLPQNVFFAKGCVPLLPYYTAEKRFWQAFSTFFL